MKKKLALALLIPLATGMVNTAYADGTEQGVGSVVTAYDAVTSGSAITTGTDSIDVVASGDALTDESEEKQYATFETNVPSYTKYEGNYSGVATELQPFVLKVDGAYSYFSFTPHSAVDENTVITFKVSGSGATSFKEELLQDTEFKTKSTGLSYDQLVESGNLDEALSTYIKGEGSNELPYKVEYVDANTVKVTLCPLAAEYSDNEADGVTDGIAKYKIYLPIEVYPYDETKGYENVQYVYYANININSNNDFVDEGLHSYFSEYAIIGEKQSNITSSIPYATYETNMPKSEKYTDEYSAAVAEMKPMIIKVDGEYTYFSFTPHSAVDDDTVLTFKINYKNDGRFREDLLPETEFRTKSTGLSYDQVVESGDLDDALRTYIKGEGSNELPYKVEYVDAQTVKVKLCPLAAEYADNEDDGVTEGVAKYKIYLPVEVYGELYPGTNDYTYPIGISINDNDKDFTEHAYAIFGRAAIAPWKGNTSSTNSSTSTSTTTTASSDTSSDTSATTSKSTSRSGGSKRGRIVYVDQNADTTTATTAVEKTTVTTDNTSVAKKASAKSALREAVEKLASGATIKWDGQSKSAEVSYGDLSVVFKANSDIYTVNGVEYKLGDKAEIINDRMYIPTEVINKVFN